MWEDLPAFSSNPTIATAENLFNPITYLLGEYSDIMSTTPWDWVALAYYGFSESYWAYFWFAVADSGFGTDIFDWYVMSQGFGAVTTIWLFINGMGGTTFE